MSQGEVFAPVLPWMVDRAPTQLSPSKWFESAIALLPVDLLSPSSLQVARRKLLGHTWNFGSYAEWASYSCVSPKAGLDWQALKAPDPARADRQRSWTCYEPLLGNRDLLPHEHVAHAQHLHHPFVALVHLETDIQYAVLFLHRST